MGPFETQVEAAAAGLERVWSDHPRFGPETVGEFLDRHRVKLGSDGKFTMFHGRPKGSTYNFLRAGSLLAWTVDDAAHYAGRDRELSRDEVEVIRLRLTPDDIDPGIFVALRRDYRFKPGDMV